MRARSLVASKYVLIAMLEMLTTRLTTPTSTNISSQGVGEDLEPTPELFDEYIEMALQFGYISMFGSCFFTHTHTQHTHHSEQCVVCACACVLCVLCFVLCVMLCVCVCMCVCVCVCVTYI